jgi:polyhydroxyalkanoate synthesis regulator phasin
VAHVNEERKLILQMVAEGKITPDEADKLLQALDETERSAESAAAERVERAGSTARSAGDLGNAIEEAVRGALQGLDSTMRSMEIDLERRLNDPARKELLGSIEEKIRRSVERSVERAARAEERAARVAEKAGERAQEIADRTSRKVQERMEHAARRMEAFAEEVAERPDRFIKVGVSVDKTSVQRVEDLSVPAEPGDRFVLENRVGDVGVEFYDGNAIEVTVRKQVWGEDEADANERADATRVRLVRSGPDVQVVLIRPSITGVGVLHLKETRTNYSVRLPHGTHLNLRQKVGDVAVTAGEKVGTWHLFTKVGDVNVKVLPAAGFTYELSSQVGDVQVDLAGVQPGVAGNGQGRKGLLRTGRVGDGSGYIEASAQTGEIRVTN